MYDFILNSPIGNLGFRMQDDKVCKLDFLLDKHKSKQPKNLSHIAIAKQCDAYFKQQTKLMDLPFVLSGTPFQQKVWHRMHKIPYGKTMTYGELAKELKTSAQAVGNACRANPVPLIIPCHRVVGANSKGGFAGATEGRLFAIKLWLLEHEGQGTNYI